jgi:carbon monoxide dehydrogenase subunit G
MELANTRSVPASPEAVFDALNDPAVLRECVPGCESLERIGADAFHAQVTARIGPVAARFSGRMTLADVDPPRGYTLRFEGQGGAAGFARGEARVTLAPDDAGHTAMHYEVKAQVGGKLAQIGSRLVDGAAAKLADDFFARLAAHFAVGTTSSVGEHMDAPEEARGEAVVAGEGGGAASSPAGGAPPEDETLRRTVERGTWTRFLALAAIIVILAYLYFRGRIG